MKTEFCSVPRTLYWIILLFVSGHLAWGATIVWNNPSGGNWNVAANWSPNQVPGASDTALIVNNGNYVLSLETGATVKDLALGAASGTQTLSVKSNDFVITGTGRVDSNGVLNFSGRGSL